MAWTAPVIVEVCVGMEITSYKIPPKSDFRFRARRFPREAAELCEPVRSPLSSMRRPSYRLVAFWARLPCIPPASALRKHRAASRIAMSAAAILLGFDSGPCALSYDLDRRGRAALR